jgi:hypothetical protein
MSQRYAVNDMIGFRERVQDLDILIEVAIDDVTNILEVDLSGKPPIPLTIHNGSGSEASRKGIMITPREDARCGVRDWFDLLFRHELTHLLVGAFWGKSCLVIFWEGVPVYVADNMVRQRIFDWSYHDYCAALSARSQLVSLTSCLLPQHYYGLQHDFRVTVEAGSFTGFIMEQYGIQALRQAFASYVLPTPQRPVLELTALCSACWDKSFDELTQEWHQFLAGFQPISPEALEAVERRAYPKTVSIQDIHCPFCYAPISPNKNGTCPRCHSPLDTTIQVI